jgi:LL-diaminopimelate aminotransferase
MKKQGLRMDSVQPSFYAELDGTIAGLRARGMDVIRLDIGSPDLPPSPEIIETLAQSARHPDHHGYQPINGPKPLREAWAKVYARLFDVDLDPDGEIVPLHGSKEGIFHFTLANTDADDVVLISEPAYPIYAQAARFVGAQVELLPSNEESGFLPDFDAIPAEIAERARLLWLNYPNNPTGATAPMVFFERAVAFAQEYNLVLCHDAAYCQVTFEGYRVPSPLQIEGAKAVTVEFNSLSKSHNMAGWRMGVLVGASELVSPVRKLKPSLFSGQFKPMTDAATAALNGDQSWLEARNETYRQRRDLILRHLNALGVEPAVPRAALYIWMPVPEDWAAVDFTATLLENTGVSLTPGTVFGESGEGYARISLGASNERIEEGMGRITDWWRANIG